MCLLGAVLGAAVAIVGSGLVEDAVRSITDLGVSGSIVRITPGVVGYSVLCAVILGFVGRLYPAWRAPSMRSVEAIREGGVT